MVILLGITAGFVGSILGIGGGSIMTPILVALGYDIKLVVPASLIAIVGTSIGGLDVYLQEGYVDLNLALFLETSTVVGAIIAATITLLLPSRLLEVLLGIILLIIAFDMMLAGIRIRHSKMRNLKSLTEMGDWKCQEKKVNLIVGWLASSIAGAMSAFTGIGGGVLKVPIMNRIIGVPIKVATATSKLMVGITAAAGAISFVRLNALDYNLALELLLGTVIGGLLGSHTGIKVGSRLIMLLFSCFMVLLSIILLFR